METSALSHQLRELRIQAGLTQVAAAQALGIANTTLSQYESGKRIPGIKMLKSLGALYSMPLDQFFSAKEKQGNSSLSAEEIAKLCALKTRVPELLECLCRAEDELSDEKLALVRSVVVALME